MTAAVAYSGPAGCCHCRARAVLLLLVDGVPRRTYCRPHFLDSIAGKKD